MPSPTSARARAEWYARLAAIVALIALGWRLVTDRGGPTATVQVATAHLPAVLAQATHHDLDGMHLTASRLPDPASRDWLRALSAAGTSVSWNLTSSLVPLALSVEPIVVPDGGVRIDVVAAGRSSVRISDDAGDVDSLPGIAGAVAVHARTTGAIRVSNMVGEATAPTPPALRLRPILVVGEAGWESKFLIAALEESGWNVAARLTTAPGIAVVQGSIVPLDTARYAAVVVLDSLAFQPSELSRFAQSGGGVVLGGVTVANARLVALAGASVRQLEQGRLGAVAGDDPTRGLAARVFAIDDRHAATLDRRNGAAVMVARRLGAGRVLAIGLQDTWRWRMQGADGSVPSHRAFWSGAVARVAHVSAPARDADGFSAAPLAGMVARLGPPSEAMIRADDGASWLLPLLFAIVVLGLLVEWTSRRLRGER